MTFDISLEAIEADFALAEHQPGTNLERLSLAKAHVRAILLAAQPPLRWVMPEVSTDQGWDAKPQPVIWVPETNTVTSTTEEQADAAAEAAGTIIDGPTEAAVSRASAAVLDYDAEPADDVDKDFFAEAKKERGR